MGHWILEVTKVGIYIGLPLTSFIVFNSPSFYVPILYDWRKKNEQFVMDDEEMFESKKRFLRQLRETKSQESKNIE